jgi:hypothetical protein
MKKCTLFIWLALLLSFCEQKNEKVEIYVEDEVKVVVNHYDSGKIKNEHSIFSLEEELKIVLETESITNLGLVSPSAFDVDSEGNIYFVSDHMDAEKFIFKFGKDGNFITSFGYRGIESGKIQSIEYFGINHQEEIIVTDYVMKKVVIFNKEGCLVKEIPYGPNVFSMIPLENGNYLTIREWFNFSRRYFPRRILLCNSEFEKINTLDVYHFPNPLRTKVIASSPDIILIHRASQQHIYIGNEQRGYEILVFDLNGNLVRKIRKDYEPVKLPYQMKQKWKKFYEDFPGIVTFPEHLPPFATFFIDDGGKIFVRTFEKGVKPGLYIYEIFNSEGIFMGRKSLGMSQMKIQGNRLYGFREHQGEYKELTVYRMKWK